MKTVIILPCQHERICYKKLGRYKHPLECKYKKCREEKARRDYEHTWMCDKLIRGGIARKPFPKHAVCDCKCHGMKKKRRSRRKSWWW